MVSAAAAFLDALSEEQRGRVTYAFDDTDERTSWAFFPREAHGIFLFDLDPAQQKLAHALLSCALSFRSYAQTTAIMALERLVHVMEGGSRALRDPGRYALSIFGVPGADRWSWRLEGHHVVLNFTIAGETVIASTPLFLGAQPAFVRHGDAIVSRPCGEEEDAARALLLSLDSAQRAIAVLTDAVPPDFVLAAVPRIPDIADAGPLHPIPHVRARYDELPEEGRAALRFERARPAGIAAQAMTPAQRVLLSRLIDVYVGRLSEDLAASARVRLEQEGIDHIHFAWAGAAEAGLRHYYRLQGRSFIVEYDVTQEDANHVHTVWRDADNDFGYDALRAHLSRDH